MWGALEVEIVAEMVILAPRLDDILLGGTSGEESEEPAETGEDEGTA